MGPHTIREDVSSRDILDAIRRIVRSLRESSRSAEQQVGVSGAQLFVLQRLAENGPCSVNELAEATLTHQSSVSVVLARLQAQGLVRRATSREDRRRQELSLTPRGRALLSKAPDAAQERLITGVRQLPARERNALARGLTRLVGSMGLDARPPAMFFEERASRGRKAGAR